jgi:hypothetical protein
MTKSEESKATVLYSNESTVQYHTVPYAVRTECSVKIGLLYSAASSRHGCDDGWELRLKV